MEKLKSILSWVGVSILAVVVVAAGITLAQMWPSGNNLGLAQGNFRILAGRPAQTSGGNPSFVHFPYTFIFDDSTTTSSIAPNSPAFANIGTASTTGGLINQLVYVEDYTEYAIYVDLRGGTATSTFCLEPMWSFDTISYYNWTFDFTASTTANLYTTSTPSVTPLGEAVCIDPGTATTSLVISGTVPNATSARFLFRGEDVATDPEDGVEGSIVVKLKNSN